MDGNLFIGDQACHGCNQGPKAADIGAYDQLINIIRITGEQHGGGDIADDLTQSCTEEPVPSGEKADDQLAKLLDLLYVSHKDKKEQESQQERVIDPDKKPAVSQQKKPGHGRKQEQVRDKACHREDACGKQRHVEPDFRKVQGDRGVQANAQLCLSEDGENADRQEDPGSGGVGACKPQKSLNIQTRQGIEIQVLGIPDGCEHAAQIAGNGHKGDGIAQPALHAGHSQHHEPEGDEGDQSHIIGYEHAAEKTEKDQSQGDSPLCAHLFQDAAADTLEKVLFLQTLHDQHEAEEDDERVKINIIEVARIRRDDKTGQDGQTHGND